MNMELEMNFLARVKMMYLVTFSKSLLNEWIWNWDGNYHVSSDGCLVIIPMLISNILMNEWMRGWDGYSHVSWGGVFSRNPYPIMNEFNESIILCGDNAKHWVDSDVRWKLSHELRRGF